jgi:hypothetical protein
MCPDTATIITAVMYGELKLRMLPPPLVANLYQGLSLVESFSNEWRQS